MSRMFLLTGLMAVAGLVLVESLVAQDADGKKLEAPLSAARVAELTLSFAKSFDEATAKIDNDSKSLDGYSKRGDACFFLGRFKEAVTDYDIMNTLDKSLSSSHWRRGIALFYAGQYKAAASQFESYHNFDQVDRENGIWRYLSQHRAYGRKIAREGLLKYEKDDREPFPAVYKLFAGTMTPDQILEDIAKVELSKTAREMRLFYAHLYIGLNYAVEDQEEKAREHLAKATTNTWPLSAGYGPLYMWHVARLHEELLRKSEGKLKVE